MEGRDESMWMVGIKNGVRVWNRVPSDLTSEVQSISKSQVPSPKKEPIVKKKVTKSKVTTKVSESESSDSEDEKKTEAVPVQQVKTGKRVEIKDASDDEEEDDNIKPNKNDDDEDEESKPVEVVKPKRTYKKKDKAADTEKDKEEVKKTKPAAAKKDDKKKTRTPTDFNYFTSYQLKIISKDHPNMTQPEKITMVAGLWKKLTDDEKKDILEKAKAAV
jgi:hypothetical protein